MRRREFISLLGGAAAWPLAAWAQQPERVRRIGILMPYPPTDVENRSRVEALRQELQRLGWRPGANIEFDERWTTNNMDLIRANAANLVELKPDVIVASGGRVIPVLLQPPPAPLIPLHYVGCKTALAPAKSVHILKPATGSDIEKTFAT